MSASREIIRAGLRPAMTEAIEKTAASLDFTGNKALRILLHAGLSVLWPILKATPGKQIQFYESTLDELKRRWDGTETCTADPLGSAMYKSLDADVTEFLEVCARRSDTQWLEPVDAIAAYLLAVIQGVLLRWLADCDDEIPLVVLDDLVSYLSTKVVELP